MQRGTTRICLVLAALVVAGSTTFVGVSPTYAAGCYALGCAGWDPNYKACYTDSQTTASYTNPSTGAGVTVYNRFSGACDANWAAAHMNATAIAAGDRIHVDIWTWDSHNPQQYEQMCEPNNGPPNGNGSLVEDCTSPIFTTGYPWSDMVDGTNVTYAAAVLYDSNGNFIGITPEAQQ